MAQTLREYHTLFLEELRKQKKAHSTVLAYGKDVDQFIEIAEKSNNELPSQVSLELVESFSENLQQKRYTNKSIVRKLNSLKAFFTYLRETGVIEKNPVSRVIKPKYESSAPRILTKTEYRSLRDACRGDKRMSAVVELLLQTGMRISELAGLKIDGCDLDKRTLTIKDEETGMMRTIPMNNAASRVLQEYLTIRPKTREKTLFITKTCKPFLIRNIRSAIDRYFRIAGITKAKVNDLRHTFIVEQLAAGTPLVYVSQLVGHKRITTTEKYLQFLGGSLDTSTMKIEEL
ncbi:MAG: tyrosine-type recombinase/integrase [Candidatus Pacebacteria bacterium]|nr:tyrosine-type recombinase/integrase [Candidatus Paceibacterota bacterium]